MCSCLLLHAWVYVVAFAWWFSCFCWKPTRWQTSQVSGCWPQAAGSWTAKGIAAASSHLRLNLWPARHRLNDLQPWSARIALRQQETPQQQGEFRGGLFLKSSLQLNLAFRLFKWMMFMDSVLLWIAITLSLITTLELLSRHPYSICAVSGFVSFTSTIMKHFPGSFGQRDHSQKCLVACL